MKTSTISIKNAIKNNPKHHKKSNTLVRWFQQWFDLEHRYRRKVQRFLHLELDVIHRGRHYLGRNLTVVQVKLLHNSTRHHRSEYVVAKSFNGNWVEVQLEYHHGVRAIQSINALQEADARVELQDDPELYQQHFGMVEDI